MTMIERGWLRQARRLTSPNCDARPAGEAISLLVVHGISLPPRQYGGCYIEDLFCNRLDPAAHPYFAEIAELRVSAHVLIRRDGELLQFVPFAKRAWHAGVSCFQGRERCNDFSIGVELEGCDDEPYEPIQYRRLAQVTRGLMAAYPGITPERIVGHCDIAPGRKSDPGAAFDWGEFRRLLAGDQS
ncbi:N-acetyl-anhydromuranmyl-L-alanine amidase [Candidatus Tenderia electrophaga]|uniref:1,6-anhydro-N-acetylmuramyl-L-alanine amidase AmpD n=1 Tax=Candidatus Tenderia electrophaga TaxID=1748243 RepID=A0A0S2T9N4_9GAMM|nr:N-acetyl-anhydromuranmyl-L-alanine amidase [Candidatus Tenderia electrophaga]